MSDLAEWLEVQIAEDERRARAARRDQTEIDRLSRQPIRTVKDDGVWTTGEHAMDEREVTGAGIHIYDEGGHTLEQAVHIATWDPARVLAECDTKRRIIDQWRTAKEVLEDMHAADNTDWEDLEGPYGEIDALDTVLKLLAVPYADRPGYLAEWRPGFDDEVA